MKRIVHHFKSYVERSWYGPLLAFLAAADYFVIVIPTDGLLITSSIAAPSRWLRFSLWQTLGSLAGGLAFALVIRTYGGDFLEWLFPAIHQSKMWTLSDQWMNRYGLWALFLIAALPMTTHPVLAIAALVHTPFRWVALALFGGRITKYCVFAWLASHTPHLLLRFKGISQEIKQAKTNYMED